MMQYKGYVAALEFDESAGRLDGRVVNSGAYHRHVRSDRRRRHPPRVPPP